MTPTIEEIQTRYERAILSSQELYAERRDRDTAGEIRYTKGKIVEDITKDIISIAWSRISDPQNVLRTNNIKIPIKTNGETFKVSHDINVYIDDVFRISVECKSFMELTLYKRFLMEAYLLKRAVTTIEVFFVVQLENALGGDYGASITPNGRSQVIWLNKQFPDLNISIITLLDGKRASNKPLHMPEYFRPLTDERLEYAIDQFAQVITKCLNIRE